MIVVTGATGKLGRLVIEALMRRSDPSQIIAAVRNPERMADLTTRGIKVRHADFDKPGTLIAAFMGAKRALLISSNDLSHRTTQHLAAIEAAKRAGVQSLSYTSLLHADTSKMRLAAAHKATEQALIASGMAYTILRNSWYLENYTEHLAPMIAEGTIHGCAALGRVCAASRNDLAEAAAVVLTKPGHDKKIYELAGDQSFSMSELAAAVATHSGKAITYDDMSESDYNDHLVLSDVPQAMADVLSDADAAIARGEMEDKSGALHRLIGHETTGLSAALAALAALKGVSA